MRRIWILLTVLVVGACSCIGECNCPADIEGAGWCHDAGPIAGCEGACCSCAQSFVCPGWSIPDGGFNPVQLDGG
jgi:hypothetical protein